MAEAAPKGGGGGDIFKRIGQMEQRLLLVLLALVYMKEAKAQGEQSTAVLQ